MHHPWICLEGLRKNIKNCHASRSPHTKKIWNPEPPKCKQYSCPIKWHSLPTHVGTVFISSIYPQWCCVKWEEPVWYMLPPEWQRLQDPVILWYTSSRLRGVISKNKFYDVNHHERHIKVGRHLSCLGWVNLIRVYFLQVRGLWHSNCNPAGSCINLVQDQFIQINKEETCVTYTWKNKYTILQVGIIQQYSTA